MNEIAGCATRMRKVVIMERILNHYRVPLYAELRNIALEHGIELQLLIGKGAPAELQRKDEGTLSWAIPIPTRYMFGNRLCWQSFGLYARDADMVIVMHENKLLYNLWLLTLGRPRRLAFWGHGRNMQSRRPGLKERFKRWTVNKVDWWFAYTDSSADIVRDTGFPDSQITVVDNAIDTDELSRFCKEVSLEDCQDLKRMLGLQPGPVGLYLGSLYPEKRLDFLLDATLLIRQKLPSFQLLVVGAGPNKAFIEASAIKFPWLHYLGPLQGRDKARVLITSDLILNPGLVGLGILDSFAAGRPMFTTDCEVHSPEISYLLSGENGVMTANNVDTYADAVSAALSDPIALARLQTGALSSASRYTIDNMASRICNGILGCLAIQRGQKQGEDSPQSLTTGAAS